MEGIFRVSGTEADRRKIKQAYDKGKTVDLAKECHGDLHVVSGALKLFLQEMDDALLTGALYPSFMEVAGTLHSSVCVKLPPLSVPLLGFPEGDVASALTCLLKTCSKCALHDCHAAA
jgi:hypothetical protein